jgi:hypothetical protein
MDGIHFPFGVRRMAGAVRSDRTLNIEHSTFNVEGGQPPLAPAT